MIRKIVLPNGDWVELKRSSSGFSWLAIGRVSRPFVSIRVNDSERSEIAQLLRDAQIAIDRPTSDTNVEQLSMFGAA